MICVDCFLCNYALYFLYMQLHSNDLFDRKWITKTFNQIIIKIFCS